MTKKLDERLWKLIARKVSGEASDKDLKSLDKLLEDHPSMKIQMKMIIALWNSRQPPAISATESVFENLLSKMKK